MAVRLIIRADSATLRRWCSLLLSASTHAAALVLLELSALLAGAPAPEPAPRYVVRVFYVGGPATAPPRTLYLPATRTAASTQPPSPAAPPDHASNVPLQAGAASRRATATQPNSPATPPGRASDAPRLHTAVPLQAAATSRPATATQPNSPATPPERASEAPRPHTAVPLQAAAASRQATATQPNSPATPPERASDAPRLHTAVPLQAAAASRPPTVTQPRSPAAPPAPTVAAPVLTGNSAAPLVLALTGVPPDLPSDTDTLRRTPPPRRTFLPPPARTQRPSNAAALLAEPEAPEAPGNPVFAATTVLAAAALPVPLPGPPPPTSVLPAILRRALRLDHPAGGTFDVVLVQPSLSDLLPRNWKGMASTPVYTVYLNVGDAKEWMLHFCAPDTQTRQQGSVVTLGDPRPVAPPYPRVTYLPEHLPPPAAGGRTVLVHGWIDASGAFQGLRVLGEDAPPLPEGFLTVLSNWLFRPARRGSDPAPVEVVLAVPARRT